ncbi:MAG TPA: carboxylesterase family protein, partial [Lacisediminihabitans sp.]|uniref:carboxylesterase family protein n=1 Tax=Lacisediminihabitans sp. TaxID=2787631 RepID=UPI002ED7BC57
DPDRVTIFGQSGGGVSVMFHLALPSSRGLFAQAIAQSGCSMASVDADEAFRITKQVAKELGVAPTVEGMSGVSLERTAEASAKASSTFALGIARADRKALLLSPFRGVEGTKFLPKSPFATAGTYPSVPLLAGTCRNETAPLLDGIAAAAGSLAPLVRRGLRRALELNKPLLDAYSSGPRHIADNAALVEAAWTDWAFRMPTIRLIEARPEPSWLYEFRWQRENIPPASGSFHAIDLPFVRDDLELLMAQGQPAVNYFGSHPPKQLAERMHRDFVRFATTGNPGWQQYDAVERTTTIYDTATAPLSDAAGVEREAWEGKR